MEIFPGPWAPPHAGGRGQSRVKGKGREQPEVWAGLPHLCFWTGSRHESPMWSESQGATVSACSGNSEKPCHRTGQSPEPAQRPHQHPRPSQFGAVHGLHSPEPVLREVAAHKDVIFIDQLFFLQHFLGWGRGTGVRGGLDLSGTTTVPQLHLAAHLGQSPPGFWFGSCAGPQQTGNRTRRAPGSWPAAPGLPAAHRCAPWATVSARPGSSAWPLGKHTGPLEARRGWAGAKGLSLGPTVPWRHQHVPREPSGGRRTVPSSLHLQPLASQPSMPQLAEGLQRTERQTPP